MSRDLAHVHPMSGAMPAHCSQGGGDVESGGGSSSAAAAAGEEVPEHTPAVPLKAFPCSLPEGLCAGGFC